jgi:restriction system protein
MGAILFRRIEFASTISELVGYKSGLALTQGQIVEVVVKALWADVANEKAGSGFIVTTSALSPGARRICTARAYPILEANRKTIGKWIGSMRTPSSGVFMGE